jgi:DNA-binding CsgD family transcriptional regulator
MALGRGTLEICTDREMPILALEHILAGQFRCERCPPEHLIAVDRANVSDGPAAIAADLPHEPLRTFTRSPGGAPIIVWQRSKANEPSLNALDSGAARVVTSGQRWVPPSVTQTVLNTRRCRLSRTEGQLVKLVAPGLRNKEIAFALGITEETVKVYLSRLFSKVGVSDRHELAFLGLRHSWNESAYRASAAPAGVEAGFSALEALYIHRDVPPPRPS